MTVVLVIVAWMLGTFGDDLPKGGARVTGLLIHVSAGLSILVALHAVGVEGGRSAAAP
jgi:cytochrome b561